MSRDLVPRLQRPARSLQKPPRSFTKHGSESSKSIAKIPQTSIQVSKDFREVSGDVVSSLEKPIRRLKRRRFESPKTDTQSRERSLRVSKDCRERSRDFIPTFREACGPSREVNRPPAVTSSVMRLVQPLAQSLPRPPQTRHRREQGQSVSPASPDETHRAPNSWGACRHFVHTTLRSA